MAIPDDRTSSLLISGNFIPPDDLENYLLKDYELGGIGLNDPSAGLRYQPWTLLYYGDTGDMVIEAPNTPPTILFNRSGITEISLAFDQNMNPFVAFVENGTATFWWYDTDIADTTFTTLPANSLTPRCCLDDKRESQNDANDIVLCYVNSGRLLARYQRDRYQIEETIENPFVHPVSGEAAVLKRVGMNEHNRLQWIGVDLAMNEVC